MSAPNGYVDSDYLDDATAFMLPVKLRGHALLRLSSGERALDAGCGPASDTLALAALVGPAGEVYGIDADREMVAEADRRAQAAGVAGWTHHRHAPVQVLPFAAGYFDAVYSERMLQHLPDPESAVAELMRVVKPGGRVVVVDADWGSLSVGIADARVERAMVAVQCFERSTNAFSGRRLPGWLAAAGLRDVHVEVHPLATTNLAVADRFLEFGELEALALAIGRVTRDEVERWRAGLLEADAKESFFCCVNLVLVAGYAA